MISVQEALRILASATAPGGMESVSLSEALGRVLAGDIVSDADWPPFDTSAMDGYAVRVADVPAQGSTLRERQRLVAAGDPPPADLEAGEAVRVMTGAPIPGGTEAIIPVEHATRQEGRVVLERVAAPGAHIRRQAESVAAGSTLVRTGRRLTPGDLALAALAGAEPLKVFRRPRIVVAPTGNELVPVACKPGPGQLRDSNGPMIAALCRSRGWPAELAERVGDQVPEIEALFARAGTDCDVLVTSGGVSAGDLDLLPAIAARLGFQILFHGVAVRPGKPVAVGRRGGLIWFGLPGNPVSSAVAFQLFVRFALDRLEGDARPGAARIDAHLASEMKPTGPRETYRDALLTVRAGQTVVDPISTRGSHDISAYAGANALIRLPAGSPSLPVGAIVECLVLGEVRP